MAWQNGTFLVKLPQEVIDVQINNVEINNSNVSLQSYELIEENGERFIKIITQNSTPTTFNITIDVDITPDPRIATMTRQVELYASNENGENYYYTSQDIYDVDNDLNTEELVNYRTTSLSMVSPNSLLTNQTASNYDDKGSTVISPQIADIRPQYAIVDQEGAEEQTATIGVQIKNNYASTISEIKLVGKIPFEGNTYVISGDDLGSSFTTTMKNTGIQVPEELAEYVTVYYSEEENPTNDIEDEGNKWVTAEEVENWNNVKTYLIDLGDYVMPTGAEYVFYYTVEIPNGLEFNQVAYSHHAVYFCLDTDQGKYRTQTEPNKIGLRIAEKYNLELTKYQTGRDIIVPGATYSITEIITNEEGEEERGESKTGVTNAEGKIEIINLYAEKEYEIKEIKTPDDYELNSEVIRFIGNVDENGVLTIEKKEGTTRDDITVTKEEGEEYQVTVNVEDEVKASIKIIKKEEGTENVIQGARFKLTGYGLSENGKTVITNEDGEAILRGLSVNQEYTLTEVKLEGYYLENPIKFKVVNNEGSYSVEQIGDETATGEIVSQTTTEENSIPTISITIEDEKIPTYDLQLIKIKKTTSVEEGEDGETLEETTYLEGAKFKLYKETEEIGSYTTGADGKVTITGLYQYESQKDIDQTYTLKEVLAPDGYTKVKDISFKAEVVEGNLVLKEIDEEGEEIESARYTAEGNTISLTIEDSPSFKLIKKDSETQEVLAGVKFAIYNVDDGEVPATNSKGEIIGAKETINGKEYYTVTTDKNGELTLDLPEGLYKAVEVEADDKYDLEDQEYYFGIGASREGKVAMKAIWADFLENDGAVNSAIATKDGGYIAVGYSDDGDIVKYNENGEIEWYKIVNFTVKDVIETENNEYIVVGVGFEKNVSIGDGINITGHGNPYNFGVIAKYNSEGIAIWGKAINGSNHSAKVDKITKTKDGGFIVSGDLYASSVSLGNNIIIRNHALFYYDAMIMKYDSDGNAQWGFSIGGDKSDYIQSVYGTEDGGCIVGGLFASSEINLGNITLNNNGSNDGMIIKYSSQGDVEWASNI